MKSKSIYRSCQYWKQLSSISKDPNYDLIMPNRIIRHFIVFIEAEEVKKLLIPVGITRQKGLTNLLINEKNRKFQYGNQRKEDSVVLTNNEDATMVSYR